MTSGKAYNGRISNQPFPRTKGWELVNLQKSSRQSDLLSAGLGVPLCSTPYWVALPSTTEYRAGDRVGHDVGFRSACVEAASFRLPLEDAERIEQAWAIPSGEKDHRGLRPGSRAVAGHGGLNSDRPTCPPICHSTIRRSLFLKTRGRDQSRVRDQVHGAQVVSAKVWRPTSGGCDGWGCRPSHMTYLNRRG